MLKNPRRIFLLLVILAVLLAVVDLPENYRVKIRVKTISIDRVINPPVLAFNALGIRFRKELKTRLGLDLSGGTHLVLEADMKDIPSGDRTNALESSRQVIERRINFFGVSEPIVQSAIS